MIRTFSQDYLILFNLILNQMHFIGNIDLQAAPVDECHPPKIAPHEFAILLYFLLVLFNQLMSIYRTYIDVGFIQ